MIRRPLVLTAVALTLGIAACDGGNDPTPSPSPSPSPTPTPTASPTYAALPVSAASEFFGFSATTGYIGNPTAGAVTLKASSTDLRSDRMRLAVSENADTGTFVVREASEESRFTKTAPSGSTDTYSLVVAPATNVPEFTFRINFADTPASGSTPAVTGKFAQGDYLNNIIPSKVTTDTGLALNRVSYVGWWRGDSTTGEKRITYSTFGYPTVATDLPTTGTVNYTARVAGRLVTSLAAGSTVEKITGTATISVNFGTGSVTITVNAVRADGTALAPMTGSAGIAIGSNQFTGSLTTGPLTGSVVGGFFGSQGEQIGINFGLENATQRAVGSVIAKKS